ncbi:hypothetical protein ANN_13248 [Periplaneta americana]|uniref:Uncharacterized protein n=1 Tax=Periplaneta americana TaxID=6978 RepID=A0ABQ8TKX1_PERAM|nr:hypothetical protein ANN_13248 [Periplaneta americana]
MFVGPAPRHNKNKYAREKVLSYIVGEMNIEGFGAFEGGVPRGNQPPYLGGPGTGPGTPGPGSSFPQQQQQPGPQQQQQQQQQPQQQQQTPVPQSGSQQQQQHQYPPYPPRYPTPPGPGPGPAGRQPFAPHQNVEKASGTSVLITLKITISATVAQINGGRLHLQCSSEVVTSFSGVMPVVNLQFRRDEVTGEWRKLHNAELHALYSSPDIIGNIKSRRLRWAGHVARTGESRNPYTVLVGRPEGKMPLGRPRRRWENNIKMDLREMGYDDREWINLAQDRDQ